MDDPRHRRARGRGERYLRRPATLAGEPCSGRGAAMSEPPPTTDSAMYVTMHRQPADLAASLERNRKPAMEAAERLGRCSRVWLVGIGTSYHAALVGEWLFRAAGLDAHAVNSLDFALYPNVY